MKQEYKNMKEHKGCHGKYYDGELWIDGNYSMHIYLSEVQYRESLLMIKLKSCVYYGIKLSEDLLKEIEEVMQLKYEEGTDDVYEQFPDASK